MFGNFPGFLLQSRARLVQRDKLRYNASVKDLSLKGCRLESVVRPFTGMQVEIFIELPGESTPIHINRGAVRWSGSQGIGVEFLTVAPAEQERLKRVVEQLSVKVGQALILPKDELPKT